MPERAVLFCCSSNRIVLQKFSHKINSWTRYLMIKLIEIFFSNKLWIKYLGETHCQHQIIWEAGNIPAFDFVDNNRNSIIFQIIKGIVYSFLFTSYSRFIIKIRSKNIVKLQSFYRIDKVIYLFFFPLDKNRICFDFDNFRFDNLISCNQLLRQIRFVRRFQQKSQPQ